METRQGRRPWKPWLLALTLTGAVLLPPGPAQTTAQSWPGGFPGHGPHRPGQETPPPGPDWLYLTPGEMKSDNNLNRFSARSVLNLFTLNSPANGGVQLGSGPEPAAPPFLPRPEVSGIIRVKGANHLSPYLYREDHSRAGPDTPAAWGRALFLPPSEYPPGAGALSRDPGPEISASFLFPGESCRPLMPGLSGGDRLPPLPPYFRDGLPDIFIPPGPPDSFPLTDNDNPERRATYVVRGSRLADHHPGLDYPGALAWPPGDLAEIILAWTLEITEPGGNPFRLWLGFFIPGTFFDIFFPPPRPPVPLPASGWLFLSGLVGLALKFLGRKKKL